MATSALVLPAAATAMGRSAFPFEARDVVVFQGDSITDGGRMRKGADLNHIMGQDYAYLIAARVGADRPELKINFINRGVGGDTVARLETRWEEDTLSLSPNLLSIMIGINDTHPGKATSAQAFAEIYEHLIRSTSTALPRTRIVLCEPFLLSTKSRTEYAAEMIHLRQIQSILRDLGKRHRLTLVRFQAMFDRALARAPAETWAWDGVHPTYAGHELMAREWLRAVGAKPPH